MTRRGRFLSEKTTLYNFGADVCHTNLAAFVKKTCRVVVPCNDIYHLCPDLTFILDVSPSNSSASIALSLSAQTGRAPPASHGNGCPYWEPLQNARSIKCVEDYQEFGFPSLISGTPPCIQHGVNCKMYFFHFLSLFRCYYIWPLFSLFLYIFIYSTQSDTEVHWLVREN